MLVLVGKAIVNGKLGYVVQDELSLRKHILNKADILEQAKLKNINNVIYVKATPPYIRGKGFSVNNLPIVSGVSQGYNCRVYTGENLIDEIAVADRYKSRYFVNNIMQYLMSNSIKILGIYGLRRVGKTIGMFKAIKNLINAGCKNVAYILCTNNLRMKDLDDDIRILLSKGYKYIFVDEITYLKDFTYNSSFLANEYTTQGIRLVITGTNSFGLSLAESDELYDRIIRLNVTYIPFKEYRHLFGKKTTLEDYIKSGGLLTKEVFYNQNTLNAYVNTAIYKNIASTLIAYRNSGHRVYLRIPEENLMSAIIKILDIDSKTLTVNALLKRFKSRDLSSAMQLLNDKYHISDRIDTDIQEVSEELRYYLTIKNWDTAYNMKVDMSKIGLEELEGYLQEIGVFYKFGDKNLYIISGLRIFKCKELIRILIDRDFNDISNEMKNKIIEKVMDDVGGIILEEIVLYNSIYLVNKFNQKYNNTIGDTGRYSIHQERLKDGINEEVDMIIYDSHTNSCIEYEIKHTNEIDERQYRWLVDSKMQKYINNKYGTITKRVVLYLGINKKIVGEDTNIEIEYKNAGEFLLELDSYFV